MAGSKKSYIFRSACGIHSHDVKITHTHTQKGWIPLISNQRGTLESHFLGACVSWLYKSLPSPLLSLWVSRFMAEGETEGASYWHYKTPSLSHWSSFIHWLTGPGNRQPPSIRGEGASEGSSPPRKKDSQMFSSPFAKLTDCSSWRQMFTENYLFSSYRLFIHSRVSDNVCSFPAPFL